MLRENSTPGRQRVQVGRSFIGLTFLRAMMLVEYTEIPIALVVGQDRNLGGAAQLRAVNRTEASIVGVKPATQGACFHASLDSLASAGTTAR